MGAAKNKRVLYSIMPVLPIQNNKIPNNINATIFLINSLFLIFTILLNE